MINGCELPHDVESCHALLQTQAATITSQSQQIEELTAEMEKLRKLLSHFVNGHRSEKRILPAESQACLPFDSNEEFLAVRAEAEAQAEAIVQTYTVTRAVAKKKRNESLPRPKISEA
jgi:prefoldin subunit 5